MAKKKETAQTESPQEQKDALVAYNRSTREHGVLTGMDDTNGQFSWETPQGNPPKGMLEIPSNTWLGTFFKKFGEQYGAPSEIGLKVFRTPVDAVDKLLNAIVKIYIEENGTNEDRQLLTDSELNDDGRIAKMPSGYKFEERTLPVKELAEWGVTPEIMRENKCMGDFMKGRVTDNPIPIRKMVNGEWKDMGEACFCVVGIGREAKLQVLPVLEKEQFNMAPFKDLFTQEEKDRMVAQTHLGTTKVMKDFATGKECECYVSYHEPTKRINTLPVDDLTLPKEIYRQPISSADLAAMRSGGEIKIPEFQRRNGQLISGTAQVDANRRDVCFSTGNDRALKVGQRINGAPISEETQKVLESRKMAFVEGMKTKDGRVFSDDVRFSDSNTLLVGNNARYYKSRIGQENDPQARRQNKPRRGISALPEMKKGSKRKIG